MKIIQKSSDKSILSYLLRIAWIVVMGVALVGAPLNPAEVQAQSAPEQAGLAGQPGLAPVPWRDEFNGSLDAGWSWTNENAARWSLTDAPGFLRIYTSPLVTGGENLLLRPVAAGDFAIETRLLFEPIANFQIAGLVIYEDADTFLQFGRANCDHCIGNGIYFDNLQDGNFTDGNFATTVNSLDEAFLRLERRGDQVRGLFSYEGITWFEIGTHTLPSGFQVNGVGLTASQDYSPPDGDVPADFDYFELTEGGGFLPEGYHDGYAEDVPHWACNANGWAVDPDDRDTDLMVEIGIDLGTVPITDTVTAGDYREDLDNLGLCVAGTCGFSLDLWNTITHYEDHEVVAYAQDIPTGDWVQLSASPKELECRTYDIYVLDTQTGAITQTTDLRDSWEFNPRWSPDGTKIVHDRWTLDFSTLLGVHITPLATGVSAPLAGAENGNYPTWSPDGQWIAFNQGDDLYRLPPGGGAPTLISADAFIASWAPTSQRLVFQRPSDESIRTADLSGGNATLVVAKGHGPAWSPDGKWIAYDVDGDLWKVRVDLQGNPSGSPIQLTSEAAWEGRPSWSEDSQTITYHRGVNEGSDTDIWAIPAWGGEASWLTGGLEFADYDPNYSFDGRYVAYSSYTPDGQTARYWVSAYTAYLPPGSLADGNYPYHFEFQWTSPVTGTFTGQLGDFDVSDQAQLYDGTVLLRGPYELADVDSQGGLQCVEVTEINPDQPARFLMGWLSEGEMTYSQALAHFNSLSGQAVYGSSSARLERHEILPFSWNDSGRWYNYACTYTRKAEPPKQLFLPVVMNE